MEFQTSRKFARRKLALVGARIVKYPLLWCVPSAAFAVPLYGSTPHLGAAIVTLSGAFLKQRSSNSLLKTLWFAAK